MAAGTYPSRRFRGPGAEGSELATWAFEHRRLVLAVAAAAAGAISIFVAWIGVSGTRDVAEQLSFIASGGLFGLFLTAVAAMAYWGEQRREELERLSELEVYIAAIAQTLGLTELPGAGNGEGEGAGPDGSGRAAP